MEKKSGDYKLVARICALEITNGEFFIRPLDSKKARLNFKGYHIKESNNEKEKLPGEDDMLI